MITESRDFFPPVQHMVSQRVSNFYAQKKTYMQRDSYVICWLGTWFHPVQQPDPIVVLETGLCVYVGKINVL